MNTTYPNDILPFGVDASEARGDMLTLEEYLNDRQRLIGHQPGIGRRELANRQARQASHMAAALAQFIANRFEGGVRDDGDLDAVEDGLSKAVMHNFVWLPVVDYGVPSLVFGLDLKIYIALAPSGPTTKDEYGQLIGAKIPGAEESKDFWLDYAASITPPPADPYELCTTIYSRLCVVNKPGFVPVNGTLITNAVNKYPAAWAYLQTVEGQQMCVTEAEWQALVRATWHTNADGTKVGWDGVGGAAKYVIDLNAGTIRVPDLRGITDEPAGFDTLGVGAVRGDEARPIHGSFSAGYGCNLTGTNGLFTFSGGGSYYGANTSSGYSTVTLNSASAVPTGPRNHGPRWVSDARVYLGIPAS